MNVFLLLACSDPAPERTPNESTEEVEVDWPDRPDVDAAVLERMESDHIPGLAACTLVDGEIDWCQGYGWAHIDDEVPATEATPFLLASVSKTVIGVAALDVGLALDEPVVAGFEVVHPDSSTEITPRMLGGHVSGIVDNWNVMDALYVDGDSPIPLAEFLEAYLVEGGEHYGARNWGGAPGETAEYSNIGASLLALAVEVAADQDFADFCDANVFGPLGMDHTAWHLADLSTEPAMPYTFRAGSYSEEGHYGFPDYPDGQLRSSALDMATFLAEYGQDEELRDIAFPRKDNDQGFVWYRWKLSGHEVWGHNGGEVGASTEIGVLEDGRGFVVVMNGEGRYDTLEAIETAILGL
ncbi:MAG: beta-lactamase family protein [Proteobacteria bacterium]|nr:beta-lactamase family protein [Pseudomonadota bacterium]MCP4916298.1 beta-lactamase family protein [Pseudomonadota bacterium]